MIHQKQWGEIDMEVIRAFIAVNLSPDVLDKIEQVALDLQKRMNTVPIRWVPTDNIHLTLKFLGNVSTANLEILKDILGKVVANHHECDISIGGIGVFPKPHNPRVIWVGMKVPRAGQFAARDRDRKQLVWDIPGNIVHFLLTLHLAEFHAMLRQLMFK